MGDKPKNTPFNRAMGFAVAMCNKLNGELMNHLVDDPQWTPTPSTYCFPGAAGPVGGEAISNDENCALANLEGNAVMGDALCMFNGVEWVPGANIAKGIMLIVFTPAVNSSSEEEFSINSFLRFILKMPDHPQYQGASGISRFTIVDDVNFEEIDIYEDLPTPPGDFWTSIGFPAGSTFQSGQIPGYPQYHWGVDLRFTEPAISPNCNARIVSGPAETKLGNPPYFGETAQTLLVYLAYLHDKYNTVKDEVELILCYPQNRSTYTVNSQGDFELGATSKAFSFSGGTSEFASIEYTETATKDEKQRSYGVYSHTVWDNYQEYPEDNPSPSYCEDRTCWHEGKNGPTNVRLCDCREGSYDGITSWGGSNSESQKFFKSAKVVSKNLSIMQFENVGHLHSTTKTCSGSRLTSKAWQRVSMHCYEIDCYTAPGDPPLTVPEEVFKYPFPPPDPRDCPAGGTDCDFKCIDLTFTSQCTPLAAHSDIDASLVIFSLHTEYLGSHYNIFGGVSVLDFAKCGSGCDGSFGWHSNFLKPDIQTDIVSEVVEIDRDADRQSIIYGMSGDKLNITPCIERMVGYIEVDGIKQGRIAHGSDIILGFIPFPKRLLDAD